MINLESNFNFKLSDENHKKVLNIIEENSKKEGPLISILHEIQNEFSFLPFYALEIVAEKLEISLEEIYSVLTFYSQFKLQETGKYKISICQGTVCYVKGSQKLVDEVKRILNISDGEKTSDSMFSLDTTRCLGACGLAPILTVNDKVYGHVNPEDIQSIINEYKGKE